MKEERFSIEINLESIIGEYNLTVISEECANSFFC